MLPWKILKFEFHEIGFLAFSDTFEYLFNLDKDVRISSKIHIFCLTTHKAASTKWSGR